MDSEEVWKDVVGYEGLYRVSSYGYITSTRFNGKKLKYRRGRGGYNRVLLYKTGYKPKNILVHRLVAMHFIPNQGNGSYVNHIDGNKLNNYANNLEWVNARENVCHYHRSRKSKSNYRGVFWSNACNKWQAQISIGYKRTHLGVFENELDAANAYQKALTDLSLKNIYV